MKLVIVTGDAEEHRYVANQLAAAHSVETVLICAPAARRSLKTYLRKYPSRFLDKALRVILHRLRNEPARRRRDIQEVLGPSCAAFAPELGLEQVGKPNAGRLRDRVAALKPDVLAIYGTAIIPDDVLAEAGMVALNMHTGLSPWYRGAECALWPLVDDRPDMLGATVHECTSAVDGGVIYAQRKASLQHGDTLHKVFARCVKAGAEAYAEIIAQAAEGQLAGQKQDLSQGKEYRGVQSGIWSEIKAARNLARRLRKTR